MIKSGFYVATVRIRTDGRTYQPGETVEGLSEADMNYLRWNDFVKWMGSSVDESKDEDDDEFPDHTELDAKDGDPEGEDDIPEEDLKDDIPELYTEEQLNKLPSKAAIAEYAESIGLPDLNTNLHKPELIDKVLAYIEEVKKDDDV